MKQDLVLGIVGWSGSGKTTLLEFLIRELSQRAYRLNLIKHSHHDVQTEPAHKDSARLRMAGAVQTVLVSPFRVVTTHELRGAAEPDLGQLLASLAGADLCLVEGYKGGAIPKLEVHRPALAKPPLYLQDPGIIALVSDELHNLPERDGLRRFDLNQPQNLIEWLLIAMQHKKFE